MPKVTLKFPKGFLWGAATSAYQIEGNNSNSDWWVWEKSLKRVEALKKDGKDPKDYVSGEACDSYNRFEEDFALAEQLNHNATRLGIEWSRIEPKEGEYSEKELDHYEKVLQSAQFHGLKTFVTLYHYTLPIWFAKKGGFERKENIRNFTDYAQKIVSRLSQYVDFWVTINEPELYAAQSYFVGRFPPQEKSLFATWKVVNNLIAAHKKIYEIVHTLDPKPVSMAYNLLDLQPSGFFGETVVRFLRYFANEYILSRTKDFCDYIGVNYYFHHHVSLLGLRKHSVHSHELTDRGWGIHPEGLEQVLLSLRHYKKPLYILENGLADKTDARRESYIKNHLFFVHKAIAQGADVRAYLYWSLLDNFEWEEGFSPRFGLIEIDRQDFLRRKIRFSALKFAEICQNNSFEYISKDSQIL